MKQPSSTAARRFSAHLTALIALLAALFAVLPNSADAATLVTADGRAAPKVLQTWVDASALPTPEGTITIREGSGPCPAEAACATYAPARCGWVPTRAAPTCSTRSATTSTPRP